MKRLLNKAIALPSFKQKLCLLPASFISFPTQISTATTTRQFSSNITRFQKEIPEDADLEEHSHDDVEATKDAAQDAVDAEIVDSKTPLCPRHRVPTVMRRVGKNGPHRGKFFYSCTAGRCKFFMWVHAFKRKQAALGKSHQPNDSKAPRMIPVQTFEFGADAPGLIRKAAPPADGEGESGEPATSAPSPFPPSAPMLELNGRIPGLNGVRLPDPEPPAAGKKRRRKSKNQAAAPAEPPMPPTPTPRTPSSASLPHPFATPFSSTAVPPVTVNITFEGCVNNGLLPGINDDCIKMTMITPQQRSFISDESLQNLAIAIQSHFPTVFDYEVYKFSRKWFFPLADYEKVFQFMTNFIKEYQQSEEAAKVKIPLRLRMIGIPNFVSQVLSEGKFKRVSDLDYLETDVLSVLPARMVQNMLPFQRQGVCHSVVRGGKILIADEMGLGKTIQAIGVMWYYYLTKKEWPLLIACPASLKENWKSELLKWLGEGSVSAEESEAMIQSLSQLEVQVAAQQSAEPAKKMTKKAQKQLEQQLQKELEKKRLIAESKKVFLKEDDINIIQTGTSEIRGLVNIISYDLLSREHMLERMKQQEFKCIILDESHYLKTNDSKRAQAATQIMKYAKRVVCLTGTATPSRPFELYNQLRLLGLSKVSKAGYGRRYCDMKHDGFAVTYKGARHLQELNLFLQRTIMIRRLKSDVLNTLPPKQRREIYLDTHNKELSQALEASKDLIEKGLDNLFSGLANRSNDNNNNNNNSNEQEAQTTAQMTDSTIMQMYTETATAKLPGVVQFLRENLLNPAARKKAIVRNTSSSSATSTSTKPEEVDEEEDDDKKILKSLEEAVDPNEHKFLCFAHHLAMLDGIEVELQKRQVNYVRIDGSTPSEKRFELVEYFRNTPDCQVALLSIHACGTGLNFTPCARVVFCELTWTPGVLQQCEDRVHRIGQKNAIDVIYLLGHGTLDDFIWPLIQKKLNVISLTLDGKTRTWI